MSGNSIEILTLNHIDLRLDLVLITVAYGDNVHVLCLIFVKASHKTVRPAQWHVLVVQNKWRLVHRKLNISFSVFVLRCTSHTCRL